MSRPGHLLAAGALAAVALVADGGSGAAAVKGPAIRATATLTPRAVLFGDVVTARVDATVDPQRIDPRRLRLRGDFRPYQPAGPASESVRRADGLAYVTSSVRLRCWTTACLAVAKRHRLVFPTATLGYTLRAGGGGSLRLRWPALERYSRLDPVELAKVDPRDVLPWRGDETAVPRVSYGIDPGLLRGLLLGGGILLLAVAAALGARLVPRWRPALHRRRGSALSPLERALLVLENAWARSAADQRKALELLAAQLESEGQPPLAGEARELAWSRASPEPGVGQTLAARVRSLIGARTNGHRA